MRFVIFGGTTEGRTLSLALAGAGAEVTVCVASAYGQELQGETPGVEILTGPLSAEEKAALEGQIADAFAREEEIREALSDLYEYVNIDGSPRISK